MKTSRADRVGTDVSSRASIAPSTVSEDGNAVWVREDQELYELAVRLLQHLDIKTRKWRLKSYRNCFVGQDAVSWMVDNNVASSRTEAVAIGNSLIQRGWLHHVLHKHPFEDDYLFYRMNVQLRDDEGCSSDAGSSSAAWGAPGDGISTAQMDRPRALPAFNSLRKENTGEEWTLGKQLTLLQQKVHRVSSDIDVLRGGMRATMELQHKLAETQTKLDEAISAIHRSEGAAFMLLLMMCCLVLLHVLPCQLFGFEEILFSIVVLCLSSMMWHMWKAGKQHHARSFMSHLLMLKPDLEHTDEYLSTAEQQSLIDELAVEFEEQPIAGGGSEPDDVLAEVREAADVSHYPVPCMDDFASDGPVLVRLDPRIKKQRLLEGNPAAIPINTGSPIRVDSSNFFGSIMLWLRHLPSTPPGIFDGLKRNSMTIVQGKFKKQIPFSNLVSGEEFRRGLQHLPPQWLLQEVLMKVATRITPSVRISLVPPVHMLSHVVTIAQVVNVSKMGDAPNIDKLNMHDIKSIEDMRLADPRLVDEKGRPLEPNRRKRFYASPSNLEDLYFDPDLVYTFVFYEQYINLGTYNLDIVYGFDLSRYLDGQPLVSMMKDEGTGEYCFLMELWHQKLIADAHAHAAKVAAKKKVVD